MPHLTNKAPVQAANLQYSGIGLASVYSVLLFRDKISFVGWLGIGVIVASGTRTIQD